VNRVGNRLGSTISGQGDGGNGIER